MTTTISIPAGKAADWAFDNATLHNSSDSRIKDKEGNVTLVFRAPDTPESTLAFWQEYANRQNHPPLAA